MMQFIPEEELSCFEKVPWAPMVDFLFIILTVFATITVTRTVLFDQEVRLVNIATGRADSPPASEKTSSFINLSINATGNYKWLCESKEILLDTARAIHGKLLQEEGEGRLKRGHTKVLLHIDKKAPWQPIAEAIVAVREAGFTIHPVYRENAL
ncbi:MAG TPA: hypothetical protein DCY54_00805 [Parachlamydiales bacterium]|nr:MAG: hypothetical protein A3D18_00100 [Chlamydiae bacterium RIFCSPHIGHO2_02_FULL_49_29]OGN70054.1 MAG: hypothetical protein A3I15_02080 [Chlamydiae bacterium RIFCSPLOWO2_02_FULL_49_12]HAZ15178.1 hypothetical protein [Parachlamydiales bacterium]HCJ83772.1 hypothetical protein [Parachlamydiales bacterium]HKY99770.1 biopolymer transporter ExbD [Rhabdochlamydiaceae bacterium]